MEKVLDFLQQAKTWYIATVEGDQPRVRPFGAQMVYNGNSTSPPATRKMFINR